MTRAPSVMLVTQPCERGEDLDSIGDWSARQKRTVEPMIEHYDADKDMYLLAQSIDHFLNMASLMSRPFMNDYTTMIVFMSILRASVSHLNRDRSPRPEAVSGVFPDTLRRPVSILAISDLTGFPYETTRRHVLKLVDGGFCSRLGSREFIVSEEVLRGEAFTRMAAENRPQLVDFVDNVHLKLQSFRSGPVTPDGAKSSQDGDGPAEPA